MLSGIAAELRLATSTVRAQTHRVRQRLVAVKADDTGLVDVLHAPGGRGVRAAVRAGDQPVRPNVHVPDLVPVARGAAVALAVAGVQHLLLRERRLLVVLQGVRRPV